MLIPTSKLLANYAEEAQELAKHSLQFHVSTPTLQKNVLYRTSTLHYRCYHFPSCKNKILFCLQRFIWRIFLTKPDPNKTLDRIKFKWVTLDYSPWAVLGTLHGVHILYYMRKKNLLEELLRLIRTTTNSFYWGSNIYHTPSICQLLAGQ